MHRSHVKCRRETLDSSPNRAHERVNLISFSLVEVFVGHKRLRLPGQEALNAKHPQPSNHQLFKVALRA
jgi:hypothetical protein